MNALVILLVTVLLIDSSLPVVSFEIHPIAYIDCILFHLQLFCNDELRRMKRDITKHDDKFDAKSVKNVTSIRRATYALDTPTC